MAELHVFGQIQSGRNFGNTGVLCKWSVEAGSSWKKLAGAKGGQTQVDTPLEEHLAQWCHPIDIHYATKGLQGWPKLIIEVRRQDQYGRSDLAGYGTCHIPPSPGTHVVDIPTWRPTGSVKDEVVRYFIGGAPELTESDFVVNSPERYRLRTIPSGIVTAEINVVHRFFDKFGVDASEVKSGMKIVDADHFNDSNVVAQNASLPAVSIVLDANTNLTSTAPISTSTTTVLPATTVTAAVANATSTTPPASTSSTTSTPTTSTTPAVTTTTTRMPKKKRILNKGRMCGCDLHLKKCDMNCCCDFDCKPEEKELFSDCFLTDFYDPKVRSHNSHSCFRSNIFSRENSPYDIKEVNKGMFCVVTENVDNSDQLEQEPKNVDLKFLTKKKPKFSWDFIKRMQHPDISWEPYKFGSVILKATGPPDSPNISPFGIPATLYGKKCSASENIKFLQPITSFCKHQIEDLKSACTKNLDLNVNTFLMKNIAVVSDPRAMNLSESLIPVITAACTSILGMKNCEKSFFNGPSWDSNRLVCDDIMESLELTFIHAGKRGILSVIAKAEFGSYGIKSWSVRQKFSVNFVWRNPPGRNVKDQETNLTKVEETVIQKELSETDINLADYPRSGNPGYILGKPVPMGNLVETVGVRKGNQSKTGSGEDLNEQDQSKRNPETEKESAQNKQTKLSIALDHNPSGWMTIHNPGLCSDAYLVRRNVLFGLGHQTECTLKVTDFATCGDLQDKITYVILGEAAANFSDKYVSAYGNPDLNEWVPIFISGLPSLGKEGSVRTEHGCDGIIASLKIKKVALQQR
ncbi:unnamed protein product [Allacma fusca]|uniref:Tectonic-1-3 N-terminal domain-containing protein n=1 Tax=Allacma fusca TaxID=39272 RepID=A0A8J2KE10_9HEXA|nr:unnamed protein product [Allacma fusca]